MRKTKLLFTAFALLFGGAFTVSAQVTIDTDLTSQFPIDYNGWTGATGFVGWAAPKVTTNDGRETAACEKYESTCASLGDVFTRTLTGLANGTYRIELYGAAAFTPGRGFDSTLEEGDNSAVYLYATTPTGTVKEYFPAHVADNFNGTGIATAVLNNVEVTDGTVKLGMYKDQPKTNWHVVQIKGVTATVDAVALFADYKSEAEGLYSSPMKASVLSDLKAAANVDLSAAGASEYKTAIEALSALITAAKASVANYAVAKEILEAADGYDATGKASYAADETISALLTAYNDGSLDAVTNEQKTAAATALATACKAQLQPADNCNMTPYIVNPSFENVFEGWTNSGMATQDNNSFEKDGKYYAEAWQPNGTKSVSQTITLPSGLYRLTVTSKARGVTSAKLFAGIAETAITVADETNTYNVEFTCVENVVIGFEGVGTGASASWLCVDNFRLTYVRQLTDEEKMVFAKDSYDKALAAANTAYNGHENAQTGSEGLALKAEIDKTEPTTLDGYLAASEALTSKTSTFDNAYANYDLYASELAVAQAISNTITVDAPTTSAEALAAFKTLKVAEYDYVKTAYPYSATSKIGEFTTWTRTGTVKGAEKNEFEPLTSQHWSGEARTYYEQPKTGWENTAWTANYSKTTTLPAGSYVIKVAARSAQTGVTAKITCGAATIESPIPALGDTGKGITMAGVASFDEGEFANNGNGRGFVWNYLPFTLNAETEVTMTVVAEANASHCWFSVCDGELLSKNNIATAVEYKEASSNTIEDVDVANVTMTREIKASYNTVVLPFDLTQAQVQTAFGAGTLVYAYSEDSEDPTNATVNFNKVVSGAISANVPVLIKATKASSSQVFEGVQVKAAASAKVEGKNFDFVGTYAPIATIAAGDYFVGDGKVFKSAGSTKSNAFRAYIKAKEVGANIANFFIDGVEATAIETLAITGAKNNGKIYNLNGQEVKSAQKGIYIQNGRKVVIK